MATCTMISDNVLDTSIHKRRFYSADVFEWVRCPCPAGAADFSLMSSDPTLLGYTRPGACKMVMPFMREGEGLRESWFGLSRLPITFAPIINRLETPNTCAWSEVPPNHVSVIIATSYSIAICFEAAREHAVSFIFLLLGRRSIAILV